MSNGTTLGNIYVANLHRTNAEQKVEEAEHGLQRLYIRLMVLAARTPPANVDSHDLALEVGDILEGIQAEWYVRFAANHVLDWPGDCVDDFDGEKGGE